MDQHIPTVDDNLGPHVLAICTPILAIALLLYLLCEIVTYSFFIAMMVFGFGRHTSYLSVDDIKKIRLCSFSIGLVGQIAQILLLCSCRPIQALWEVVPDAKCLPSGVQWTTGYIYSGITLAADCICAVAPLFVVLKLSRSSIERALMCCSMALGVVATIATAMRIKHMRAWQNSPSGDFRAIFPLYFLTRVEELALLVAASAPFLKPAIERLLCKWGMPTFRNRVRELNSHHIAPNVEHNPDPKKKWYKLQSLKEQSTSSSAKVVEEGKGSEADWNSAKSTPSKEPKSTRV
ncbi:hypothetical protein GQ44DRAFT_787261 [Phaeosphaeriaceae sp. PMI808]|nr:hypothetical protein GQ44DRAFT_787261 [Phaeosphaeriaceae sp. PMI808]